MFHYLILFSITLLLVACSPEKEKLESKDTVQHKIETQEVAKGCTGCHSMHLDASHDIGCTVCHLGVDNLETKDKSHTGLIALPAHPDNMEKSCGQCHLDKVQDIRHALHFTVKNEVNLVRKQFSATTTLDSLLDIPVTSMPATALALADDMLRRRCLRCHPYTSGDRYPAVSRGTGCASCHLQFYEGKLISHSFLEKPTDTQCLQCHYGNRVGFDYYGRYEHDMNDEYRTPYTTTDDYFRPYGIEYHQLTADIHQQKGMVCVDCHFGNQLMKSDMKSLTCGECHSLEKLSNGLPPNIVYQDNSYILHSLNEGMLHMVPLMTHPAHTSYKDKVGCQVCHAQWAFNDKETHLLRSDIEDYDDFERLTVQGSSEVEKLLLNNLDYDAEELPHVMTDKITGKAYPGLWYKGFVTRRWEAVPLGRDSTGTIQVMRPLLDLHLSWIDEDEDVRFDAVHGESPANGMLPYIPHTTGKAGLFYKDRIETFLQAERKKKQ